MQDTTQDAVHDNRLDMLFKFCVTPRTRDEIQQHIGIGNREYFRRSILKPLIESGKIKMTLPEKPSSKKQKYVIADAP